MTDAAAIKARWINYKRFPSSKTFQIILEVPIEHAEMVRERLGEPAADGSTEVAIARLTEETEETMNAEAYFKQFRAQEKPKRSWDQLSRAEQAGIACNDPDFRSFLDVDDPDTAAKEVRRLCKVTSRSLLDTYEFAGELWDQLYSDFQLRKRGAVA